MSSLSVSPPSLPRKRTTRFARPAFTLWAMGKIATVALFPFSRPAAAIAFFGGDLYVLYHLLAPSAQGLGRTFTRFATSAREVWLTIDDGPDSSDTPRILALLARHQARATFFVIGKVAAEHSALLIEIGNKGTRSRIIRGHIRSAPFWCASRHRVAAELDRTLATLKNVGVTPRWFRAPVGIKSLFLQPALEARGLNNVGWSVRSLDGVARNPEKISARVMRRVEPGAIILMHEGPRVSSAVRVAAIERVLIALQAQGYRCVLPPADQLQ